MNSTIRRALVRLAALVIPVAAVACVSGVDAPPYTGPEIYKPITNGGAGGGGTGGGSAVGIWRLSTFNGHSLPDTIVNDTAPSNPDTSRLIIAVLDSARLQLDTDSTASEIDYFQLTDQRGGQGITGGPTFTFSTFGGGDAVQCGGGRYLDTLATQKSFTLQQMSCFTYGFAFARLATTYTLASDSLVGTVFYQYFDSAATTGIPVYSAQVPLVWKFLSPATGQRTVAAPSGKVMRQKRIVIQRN
jgi:hypothetical protein